MDRARHDRACDFLDGDPKRVTATQLRSAQFPEHAPEGIRALGRIVPEREQIDDRRRGLTFVDQVTCDLSHFGHRDLPQSPPSSECENRVLVHAQTVEESQHPAWLPGTRPGRSRPCRHSRIVGHSDPNVTLKVYGHLTNAGCPITAEPFEPLRNVAAGQWVDQR